MMNVIDSLKQGCPLSYIGQANTLKWRDKQQNPLARYVVTELAFAGTAITATLEGIAALIASLAVQGLNYVVPKEYNFNQKVVTPVLKYRAGTRFALSYSVAALYYNVTTKGPISKTTIQAVQNFNTKLSEKYNKVCTQLDAAYHMTRSRFNQIRA